MTFPNPFQTTTTATPPPASQVPGAIQEQRTLTTPASTPAAGGPDPFGAPAPRQGRAPRLLDLHMSHQHRLLLLAPIRVERVRNRLNPDPNAMQDRMTVDIVVLDGPPIPFGGKPEDAYQPTPHTQQANVPVLFENVFISNAGIISACRKALAERYSGGHEWMVLGRLYIGQARPDQKPPFLIGRPDLPDDRKHEGPTEEDKQLARRFLASAAALPMLNKPRTGGI